MEEFKLQNFVKNSNETENETKENRALGYPDITEIPIYKNTIIKSLSDCYVITEFIDRGVFGQVYKATQESTKKSVAIKILRIDEDSESLFELESLLDLKNDGGKKFFILELIEYFLYHDFPCFVTEFLSMNLIQFIEKNGPIALSGIRSITYQMLRALVKLQEHGIIHSDIKPENIMLVNHKRYPYSVRLVDFGSSVTKYYFHDCYYVQSRHYRAPEVLLGCQIDAKIDMWSLGCVMAELFYCSILFPGKNEYQQLFYITMVEGMPPKEMLSIGSRTSEFFDCQTSKNGDKMWSMKSKERYYAGAAKIPKDVKVDIPRLSDLVKNQSSWKMPSAHYQVLFADFVIYSRLLDSILKLNPAERIDPIGALSHGFIDFTHFLPTHSQYTRMAFWMMPSCYRESYRTETVPEDPKL